MSGKRIQLKRGTAAQNSTFTGLNGEVTVDTTKKTLIVHDGTTMGGTVLAKDSDVVLKVDKVVGKQLSTEDYTTAEKSKLAGIASGANNYTHPTSVVGAGTYRSVTVDTNGHITDGTNPTTISGYGLTDAHTKTEVNTLLALKINNLEKGVANGVATLDASGLVPSSQLPLYSGAVDSVAGKTGAVTLTSSDVGLGNVTNESKATMFTNPTFTGTATGTFSGSLSGNATSSSLLSALSNYTWSSSATPNSFNLGIQTSFVSSNQGFQNYGSVITANSYSGGGGALQLYVPYSPTYGGTGLQARFGNYDVNNGNSWTSWKTILASDNYNSYAPSLTGVGASGTWGINITGNSATATKLSTTNANWVTNGTIDNAVGMLAWKNYGNNHVIFDASNGTSPTGTAVNNTNAQIGWSSSYPTLMGWNGTYTYGVRVDSARVADSASYATTSTTAAVGTNTTQIATTEFVLANSYNIAPFRAGTHLEVASLTSASTTSVNYVKVKEVHVVNAGVVTVSFGLNSPTGKINASAQIYVNGAAVGTIRSTSSTSLITYTENITIPAQAYVQLYIKSASGAIVGANGIKIFAANPMTSCAVI